MYLTVFRCNNCLGFINSPIEPEMPRDGIIWFTKEEKEDFVEWHILCDECSWTLKYLSEREIRWYNDTRLNIREVPTYDTLRQQYEFLKDDFPRYLNWSDFTELKRLGFINETSYPEL